MATEIRSDHNRTSAQDIDLTVTSQQARYRADVQSGSQQIGHRVDTNSGSQQIGHGVDVQSGSQQIGHRVDTDSGSQQMGHGVDVQSGSQQLGHRVDTDSGSQQMGHGVDVQSGSQQTGLRVDVQGGSQHKALEETGSSSWSGPEIAQEGGIIQMESSSPLKLAMSNYLLNEPADEVNQFANVPKCGLLDDCFSEDTDSQYSVPKDKENFNYEEILSEFYKAVVEGSVEIVEKIVFKYNFDINTVFTANLKFVARKHSGWSAIHIAASLGHVKTVRILLAQGCDIEAATNEGETALHIAAKYGASEIVSVLLERNVFLRDRQNNQGATALLKAVCKTRNTFRENYRRCVDLLLGAGCNPNIPSTSKVTALHVAVDNQDPYLVRKLITFNAKVNAICDHNTSPLLRALKVKVVNTNIVMELLLAGADTSLKMNERSALHIAVSRCDDSVIETFLKRGADPNCLDASGKTPLWIAVEENNIKVVPILVRGGGNVNYVRQPQGMSLLSQAIKNNSLHMVKLLLDLGASVHTETFMWSTPLHFAVDQQNIDIIKELLRANCSLNITSNAKYSLIPLTPLQIAMKLGNVEIICLLIQAGCKMNLAWLKEDRIPPALASKPDAVRHIQKFVTEIPPLLRLSCLFIREYLGDRFKLAVRVLTQTGVIPHKIAAYVSLADILD